MSTRAKWIACLVVFGVGGLLASIPAFLGGPERKTPVPAASYRWIDRLPSGDSPGLANASTVIARAPNGQRLRGSSLRGEQLCATLEGGGGGCTSIDRTTQIQLFARDERKGGTVLWGILGDVVRAIRIRYANDSTRRE